MVPTVALVTMLSAAHAGGATVAPTPRDLPTVVLGRWQAETRSVIAGPRASSMFRGPATNLDVHWRLTAFDGTPPALDPQQARELVDLAVIGAGLGVEQTARRMLAEGTSGAPVTTELKGRSATALADIDDPARARARVRRARPRIRPGAAFNVATSVDPEWWAEQDLLSLARASTWVQARNLGVDTLRVQLSTRGPMPDDPWALGWLATARHGLAPGVSALAELRGAVQTEGRALPLPPAMRGALDLRLARDRPVFLRAEAARRPRTAGMPEDRVGLSLRANLGWRAPLPPPVPSPVVLPPVPAPPTQLAAHTPAPPAR